MLISTDHQMIWTWLRERAAATGLIRGLDWGRERRVRWVSLGRLWPPWAPTALRASVWGLWGPGGSTWSCPLAPTMLQLTGTVAASASRAVGRCPQTLGLVPTPAEHQSRKWQPTPVLLPGESRGRRGLVGCSLWGRTKLGTTKHKHTP